MNEQILETVDELQQDVVAGGEAVAKPANTARRVILAAVGGYVVYRLGKKVYTWGKGKYEAHKAKKAAAATEATQEEVVADAE